VPVNVLCPHDLTSPAPNTQSQQRKQRSRQAARSTQHAARSTQHAGGTQPAPTQAVPRYEDAKWPPLPPHRGAPAPMQAAPGPLLCRCHRTGRRNVLVGWRVRAAAAVGCVGKGLQVSVGIRPCKDLPDALEHLEGRGRSGRDGRGWSCAGAACEFSEQLKLAAGIRRGTTTALYRVMAGMHCKPYAAGGQLLLLLLFPLPPQPLGAALLPYMEP